MVTVFGIVEAAPLAAEVTVWITTMINKGI